MVTPAMRELLATAEGSGELAGEDVYRGRAEHPVCGDVLEISVRFDGDVIREFAWRADGCPATLVVAVAAAVSLPGHQHSGASDALRQKLASLGDLAVHERHAEKMMLRALAEAVAGAA